jgi:hypothetical protein
VISFAWPEVRIAAASNRLRDRLALICACRSAGAEIASKRTQAVTNCYQDRALGARHVCLIHVRGNGVDIGLTGRPNIRWTALSYRADQVTTVEDRYGPVMNRETSDVTASGPMRKAL